MANPQPTDAHLRIAHCISEAIMLRDFSKRQRKILDLVLRLSWGCGKKEAIIPRQADFAVVGVGPGHIGAELRWLSESKVIAIEGQTYSFNKNFDSWQVSRVKPYQPEALSKLVHDNLAATYQNGNSELTKTVTLDDANLPKREPETYRNGKLELTETGSSPDTNSYLPKESLKKELKKEATAAARVQSFDSFKDELRLRFSDIDFDGELEKYHLYWNDGHRKVKNPKLALLKWMEKARGFSKEKGNGSNGNGHEKNGRQGLPGNEPAGAFAGLD